MKSSSCKNKGRKGQQEVIDLLLEAFPELTEKDVRSRSSGANGEDIMLSEQAFYKFPFNVEVKRRKKFAMMRNIEQAINQAERSEGCPIVFFREDRNDWFVALGAKEFLAIYQMFSKLADLDTGEEEDARH